MKKIKFDYSWVIVGICFMMIMTSLGLCSSGRTHYLTAITKALDIPRGAFSINDTFRFVTTTVVNLYLGKLIAKFGTKKLICAGIISLIIFALLNSVATSLVTFYLASIFLGLGLSWAGTVMASTVVHKWCKNNVGTITGITLSANGIGGAIAVQLLTPIIFMEGNPFGYRISYRLVAIILAVMLAIIIFLYRDFPKDESLTVGKKKKARGEVWVGMSYEDGKKKPYFYILIVCVFITGISLQGLGGIAVPHMYDVGIDVGFVAMLSSIGSLLLAASKLTTGFIYDKFGMRIIMTIGLVSSVLSVFGLIFLSNSPTGRVIAFSRNLLSSLAMPLETVMLPLYVSEFFGNRDFDRFTGVLAAANYAGFAFGAPLGNFFFDTFGSYAPAFAVFGISMLLVTVAMEIALTRANRDRKKILAEISEAG